MLSTPPSQQQEAILELTNASKMVVEGVGRRYPAFLDLSLKIYPGERLGIFGVNAYEARTLVACLSGVEPLDQGQFEQRGSVSWPLGENDAFSGKVSGYANARFAAEVYSNSGRIAEDLRLIQDLAGVDDHVFHSPLGDWPGQLKDDLKLALPLPFDFDVVVVGQIGSDWDHRDRLPASEFIRQYFERWIDGSTLLIAANGQSDLALDYCDVGLAIVNARVVYRGDPEVCLQLVREERARQRLQRREQVDKRKAKLEVVKMEEDSDSEDAGDL
jgi:ABC-type polysaccharide/polyol phosphate transport system ATPase subunit